MTVIFGICKNDWSKMTVKLTQMKIKTVNLTVKLTIFIKIVVNLSMFLVF